MIVGLLLMLLNILLNILKVNVDGIDILGFVIAIVGLILTLARWKY